MNQHPKTIEVKTKDGTFTINESDFNEEVHTLIKVGAVEKPKAPTVEKTDPEFLNKRLVAKNGKRGAASKFLVVDGYGDAVDDKEYATEVEAIAAAYPQTV